MNGNGMKMNRFPICLLVIICVAVSKSFRRNSNVYTKDIVKRDVDKAQELELELNNKNSTMKYLFDQSSTDYQDKEYQEQRLTAPPTTTISSEATLALAAEETTTPSPEAPPTTDPNSTIDDNHDIPQTSDTSQTVVMTQLKKIIIIKETQSTSGEGDSLNIPVVKIEKHKKKISITNLTSVDTTTSEYDIPRDDKWEISRQSVKLGNTLGEGAFGKVVQAEVRSIFKPDTITTVAVKMLREDHLDAEMIALVSEVEVIKMIGKHVNIINLLGVCSQGGPLYVIVEFAQHNNLRDFLIKHRPPPEYSNVLVSAVFSRVVLTEEDLASFAHQVANGMQYLHSKKCLHRDLAARNVLVSENYIMKIADFGLARDVQGKDYYRIASQGLLPMKWMALESLSHHVFKYESDVWSYGILLWEVMTFGEAPYPSIQDWNSMINFLRSGHRLKKPSRCSDEIYAMMKECWKYEASDRPQFSEIVAKLTNRLKK
ncbi:hypothetical protein WDU94_002235 [Cyamophila willieti]